MDYKIGKLLYSLLLFFCIIHSIVSEIRKCGNPKCLALISKGKTTQRYPSINNKILSSQINEVVEVYGKSVGTNKDLWDVEINSKRGLFPSKFIKEEQIFIRQEKLINVSLTSHNFEHEKPPVIDSTTRSTASGEDLSLTGDDADFKVLVKNTQMDKPPLHGSNILDDKLSAQNVDKFRQNINELPERENEPVEEQDMKLKNSPLGTKSTEAPSVDIITNTKSEDAFEPKKPHANLQNQQLHAVVNNNHKQEKIEHYLKNPQKAGYVPKQEGDWGSNQQQIPNVDPRHHKDSFPQEGSKTNNDPQIQQPIINSDKIQNIGANPHLQPTLSTKYTDGNNAAIPQETRSEKTIQKESNMDSNPLEEAKVGSPNQESYIVPTLEEQKAPSLNHEGIDVDVSMQMSKESSTHQNSNVHPADQKENIVSTHHESNVDSTHHGSIVAPIQHGVDPTHHELNVDSTHNGLNIVSTNQEYAGLPYQGTNNSGSTEELKVDSSHQDLNEISTNHKPNAGPSHQEKYNLDSLDQEPNTRSIPQLESEAIYIENNGHSLGLNVGQESNAGLNHEMKQDRGHVVKQLQDINSNIDSSSSKLTQNVEPIIEKDTPLIQSPDNPDSIPNTVNESNDFSIPKPHSMTKNLSFDPKLIYKNMGKPALNKINHILENDSADASLIINNNDSGVAEDTKQQVTNSNDMGEKTVNNEINPVESANNDIEERQHDHKTIFSSGSIPPDVKFEVETQPLLDLYPNSLQDKEPSPDLNTEQNPPEFVTMSNEGSIVDDDIESEGCKSDPFDPIQTACEKNIHDTSFNAEHTIASPSINEQDLSDSSKSEHFEGSYESLANPITPIEDASQEQPSWYILATEYMFMVLQPILGEDVGYILQSELFHSKISMGSVALLLIISATIVILYLLHLCIMKMSNEAPLLKEMSSIKREMRFTIDENLNLKNSLSQNGDQIQTANMKSVDSSAADALQYELIQLKENCSRVVLSYEEKMHQIEQELDESTSNGLEMHKMLDELLQSQKDSTSFQASVDSLQNKLDTQKLKVETLTTDLAMKTHMNDELRIELKSNRAKVAKLDSQIEQLGSSLQESKTSKAEVYKDLKAREAQITKMEDAGLSFTKEVESAKVKIDHLTERGESLQLTIKDIKAQLSIKDAEIHVSRECCKKLQKTSNKNVSLPELFGVIELKKNLKVNEKEMVILKRDLEKSLAEKETFAAKLLNLEANIEQVKNEREEACLGRNEAESKLSVLANYFKDKESELTRELESQEHLRIDAEGSFVGIENQIKTYELEITSYRSKLDSLKVELEDQKQSYKMQLSNEEKKSHDNWISSRSLERRLDELRKENGQLRQKLTLIARDEILPPNMLLKPLPNRMEANGNMSSPASNEGDLDRSRHSPLDLEHVPHLPPMGMLPPIFPGGPHMPPMGMMPPLFPGGPHMPPPPPSFMGRLPPPPPPPHFPDRRLPPAGRIASPSFRRGASPQRYNAGSYSPSSDYSNYSDRCYSPERNPRKRSDNKPNHTSPPASRIPRRSPSNWCMPPNDAYHEKNYASDRHHLVKGENTSPSAQNDR